MRLQALVATTVHCKRSVRMFSGITLLVLVTGIGSEAARAATNDWVFSGSNARWFVSTNWSLGLPSSSDDARISNGTTSIVDGATAAQAGNLRIEKGGVRVGDVDAGTLTISGEIAVGTVGSSGSLALNFGTISANTLSIGANGTYSDSSAGNLALTGTNATIKMASTVNMVVNSVVSGTNGLIKGGMGTLTLVGNNTYSGDTAISSGTLQIGNGGITGNLGSGAVSNNGTLAFNRSDDILVTNLIGGTGNLRQSGSGTLTLTADNTYSGGTTINTGTLQVGNGGTTGSLGTGSVTNNSTLAFNRSNNMVVSNLITGTGNLRQSGSGTLTLTADNTYSGGTTINTGTLQVGNGGTTGSLGTGNITNGGTLIFNRSNEIILGGIISGAGTVIQAGGGTLTLIANSTYTGATIITNGTLQVGNGGTTGRLGTGTISNDASLVFNRSNIDVLNNAITGTGTVTQAGMGVIVFTGTNTYSGLTTIASGTLQIGNGGTTGTLGSGDVLNNASLVFDRSNTSLVSNAISGTGAVKQDGRGVLILTGSNTYAGGTSISTSFGALQVGDGGTNGWMGTGTINNTGNLIFNRSDTIVVDNQITGDGLMTQIGSGTVVLTASNTYKGITVISNGTVRVGNGGDSGSLGTGGINDNGALVFNRSNEMVVANWIWGTGTVTQAGTGKLILTADNIYSGVTVISNGTLQVGNGGATGSLGTNNILNDSALVFNRTNKLSVANLISGAGSLTHDGTGILTLTGSNTFSGGTWVQGGGRLSVKNTSALGVGDVNIVNGTLQADPMVIHVGGNYTQGTNGTLELVIQGTGSNEFDQLHVDGTASLDGTLRLLPGTNNYAPHHLDQNVLLVASNVTGRFSAVTNAFPLSSLLTTQLTYNTTNVILSWTQLSFMPYAETPNQNSIADALDAVAAFTNSSIAALIDYLDYLPSATNSAALTNALRVAFDQIAPDELCAMPMISFAGMDAAGERFLNRASYLRTGYRALYADLYELVQSPSDEDLKAYIDNPWGVYAEGIGQSVDVESDSSTAGHSQSSYGFVVGADRRLNDHLVLGLAANYALSKADLALGGSLDSDSFLGQLYAVWFNRNWHVEAMMSGGTRSFDTERPSLDGVAVGSTDGTEWSTMLNAGYDWEKNGWRFGPQALIQYNSFSIDGFTETGSMAPLKILSQSADAFHSQLGGHLSYRHHLSGTESFLTAEASLAWRHDFMDTRMAIDAQFAEAGGNTFTVYGPELGRESMVAGLGLNIQWNPLIATYLNYATQMGRSGYAEQNGAVGMRVSF